ncbi:hypothetical protein F5Y09DRAFT_7435 [Xylaria sp. FL1042]|nr:hypothetical protein F5Y09DRAFT_7435 [Xylaria sp. FL1042]
MITGTIRLDCLVSTPVSACGTCYNMMGACLGQEVCALADVNQPASRHDDFAKGAKGLVGSDKVASAPGPRLPIPLQIAVTIGPADWNRPRCGGRIGRYLPTSKVAGTCVQVPLGGVETRACHCHLLRSNQQTPTNRKKDDKQQADSPRQHKRPPTHIKQNNRRRRLLSIDSPLLTTGFGICRVRGFILQLVD